MRKAFIFAIVTAALFSLLLMITISSSRGFEYQWISKQLSSQKVENAWDDVDEDILVALNVWIEKTNGNLTFNDTIPNPTSETEENLEIYEKFSTKVYASNDLNISFQPSLKDIQPPIEITPIGFEYTYPDWNKAELIISGNAQNFSLLKNLSAYFELDAAFNENFSYSCQGGQSDWNSFKYCKQQTDYCLYLDLKIRDANGTTYTNPCTPIELDSQSFLEIDTVSGNSSGKVRFIFGKFPDNILNYKIISGNVTASTSITFSFNNTGIEAKTTYNLTATDPNAQVQKKHGFSKTSEDDD